MLNLQHYDLVNSKDLLYFLARHEDVSEFEIFKRAYREFRDNDISEKVLEARLNKGDFKDFLEGGGLPYYVKQYIEERRDVLRAITPSLYPIP